MTSAEALLLTAAPFMFTPVAYAIIVIWKRRKNKGKRNG